MDRILRWYEMPVNIQMLNVEGEILRAIKYKNERNDDNKINFVIKALEFLSMVKTDPKHKRHYNELNWMQYELLDYFIGKNIHQNNDESILKPYKCWYNYTQ